MNASFLLSLTILLCPNGLGLGGKVERAPDAPPPPAAVTALCVAPDAPLAFSGRADGRVWLHEVEQGTEKVVGTLAGAIEGVACAAGGVVVAIDDQGHLALLDLDGGAPRALGRHEPGALDVALSPDGALAATAGSDGEIRVWSLASGEETDRLEGHKAPVAALAWGPKRLWSASWDRTLRGWTVNERGRGKARGKWAAGRRELTSVAAHPSADRALTASWSGELRRWAAKGKKAEQQTRPDRPHQEAVHALAYDRTGQRAVAVASAEKQLRVFSTHAADSRAQVLTQEREPSVAVFVPGQDALLVGFYDGRVIRVALGAEEAE
jgi:cytochrome c